MIKYFSRFKKNEEGQSMVEFALVLIPLLFLVMGIIEFGWLFNGQITITGAAREGARLVAANEHAYAEEDDDKIKAVVERHASIFKSEDLSVHMNNNPDAPEEVVITVNGALNPIVGFFLSKDNPVNLEGEATMRLEYYNEE